MDGHHRHCPTQACMKPYQQRCNEFSVHDGCLFWGNRVVIPPAGRQQAMDLFHEGHLGASKLKSLARVSIWWPGMDADLEEAVKKCNLCQSSRNSPPVSPLLPWEYPKHPWVRLHADFAGPYQGKMFFVLVDAHFKWIKVRETVHLFHHFCLGSTRNVRG